MTRQANKATLENRLDTIMKKAKPAQAGYETADPVKANKWSRSLPLSLAILTVLLLFSVVQVQPKPPTITGPIAAITVNNEPAIQTADLTGTTAPLNVINAQPGFHCYAGCAFSRAPRHVESINELAANKLQEI